MMLYLRFHPAVRTLITAVGLVTLVATLPAYGQGSYTTHADGSLTITTPAGGSFSFSANLGSSSQITQQKGNANATASGSTSSTATKVTGSTDITGVTNSPFSSCSSSSTSTNTGFTLVNNTGAPFVVNFDWTGNISGSVTAVNPPGNFAKCSSSFELCYQPFGGQVTILASLFNSLSTPPSASFSNSSSGSSSVTIPNGGPSLLYFNLDPDGESITTPEPYSLALFSSGALGPLGYSLWRRRKQAA